MGVTAGIGVLSAVGGVAITAISVKAGISDGVTTGVLTSIGGVVITKNAISSLSRQKAAERKEKAYFDERQRNGVVDKKTGLYKKQTSMSQEADASKVNPGFERMNSNYKTNCVLCTTTYDMRRRGYDVTAGLSSTGHTAADIEKLYPGAKNVDIDGINEYGEYSSRKAANNLVNELSTQKSTRGEVSIEWPIGGGHSVAYEVDSKGKLSIIDGQSGTVYKDPYKILEYGMAFSYIRLDNVEPNISLMKKEKVVR